MGRVPHGRSGRAELRGLPLSVLDHHVSQLQGSGGLVGVGQGDLVALAQVERTGKSQHHGLQRQPSTQPFVVVDGVPALAVPWIQVLGQDVGRQEAPGGGRAEAIVLVEGPCQVGGERLGVPACQSQTVIAQMVHPVVLEVVAQRVGVVGGHIGADDALLHVLGQLAVQHGAVGAEAVQPDLVGDLRRHDGSQVDTGRPGLEVGLRTAQQIITGSFEAGDETVGLLGVGARDRAERTGDAHDGAQPLLACGIDETADRIDLGTGLQQARADEQCVHAQVEGVLDDGSGAIQLGGSQGRRGDLVDQRVAPPLLRTVVGPVNEGSGRGHDKCLPSAGLAPRSVTSESASSVSRGCVQPDVKEIECRCALETVSEW